jgi:hypothetical protein
VTDPALPEPTVQPDKDRTGKDRVLVAQGLTALADQTVLERIDPADLQVDRGHLVEAHVQADLDLLVADDPMGKVQEQIAQVRHRGHLAVTAPVWALAGQ